MATVDLKYDEELFKRIEEVFKKKIVPENFLLAVHKYDAKVLTTADIQRLRKSLESKSSLEVNFDLLVTMEKYKGWFDVILKVCDDSEVKQGYLVTEFKRLKSELDKTWPSPPAQIEELGSKLGNVSLTSKKDFEDDGAVCSPPAGKSNTENRRGSSTDEQNGVTMKNGKGYCNVCHVELTSEKLKDSHIVGKNHLKQLIEKRLSSNFEAPSVETTAPDNDCSFNEDWIKDCEICGLKFTSPQHSKQHMEGKQHRKKAETNEIKTLKVSPTLGPSGEVYLINLLGVGMCYLCKVSLTSKENADQHLSGRKHKNMCKEAGIQ